MPSTSLSGGSIGSSSASGAHPGSRDFSQLITQGTGGSTEPPSRESQPSAGARPVPEVAANRPPERTIGDGVVKGLRSVQASETRVSSMGTGQATPPDGPTLKVATRLPGPAERQPTQAGRGGKTDVAGDATSQENGGATPHFGAILDQLRQVSGYTVQVAVLSKAVGSFTGSVNKLIASG